MLRGGRLAVHIWPASAARTNHLARMHAQLWKPDLVKEARRCVMWMMMAHFLLA